MSSEPIRLTYLITGTQHGGAAIGMVRLLSGISSTEFDMTVIALTDSHSSVAPMLPDHVELVCLGLDSPNQVGQIRRIWPLIERTDLLLCSLFHATAIGVVLGFLSRVPSIVVWQHTTQYANWYRERFYRLVYRLADRILADSDSVQQMLVSEYDLSEDKISVLPIVGVDTSIFQPVEMEPLSGSIAVATVGRLSEAKGYDDLIDCARRLGPEYQFHVAGDGSLRDWLETEAPENVCFHGTISNGNVPDFLNGADIYFQPSKYEGLCMTVIEAMSCGLPVVASAVGGITESVVPGETGYLCERGDVGCFCSRIEALSRDSERRAEFGRGGRERVLSKYSMTELTNGFREVVRQLNHRVSGSER